MYYLAKFPINKTRRETMGMLASPYKMHAAIMGCFPTESNRGDEGRMLYRVVMSKRETSFLLISSPVMPSLVGLDEQIGWPDIEPQWKVTSYDKFLDHIEEGQRYNFHLTANPSVRNGGRHARSNRIPCNNPHTAAIWLVGKNAYDGQGEQTDSESRSRRSGFEVERDPRNGSLMLEVTSMRTDSFEKTPENRTITLLTVDYEGVLRVTDANRLRHVLRCGLGPAKGFGCGMLTLVPA